MTIRIITLLVASLLAVGCSKAYVTPGPAVSLVEVTDYDLRKHYRTKPTSPFPANVAVVRIQGSDYYQESTNRYSSNNYTVVTTRDIESDEAIEELVQLPMVNQVAPIGRLLLKPQTRTIEDLRLPAAQLHADLLLVYSVETSFSVEGKSYGPLSAISLGFIRNKKAHVTSTVAGALFDVRTGFVYGTTESSATKSQGASIWSTEQAIEASRLRAEQTAFDQFVGEFKSLWKGVVEQHAATAPHASALLDEAPPDEDSNYRIRFGN